MSTGNRGRNNSLDWSGMLQRATRLSGSMELHEWTDRKDVSGLKEWAALGKIKRFFNAYAIKSGIKPVCERVPRLAREEKPYI